ncbi:hypothetical protein PFISCL1PPCAC_21361, partial [Pristionchus fissidentatus]
VCVFHVPITVTKAELLRFMERVGPVTQLQYPVILKIPGSPFARCMYESHATALRAACDLTGQVLHGEPILVWMAKYWREGATTAAAMSTAANSTKKNCSLRATNGVVVVSQVHSTVSR